MQKTFAFSLFVLTLSSVAIGQQTIYGHKFAHDGEILIGSLIQVPGTNIGTVTDEEGFYELEIPSRDVTLRYLFFDGYNKGTMKPGNAYKIDVIMGEEWMLPEYGSRPESNQTGLELKAHKAYRAQHGNNLLFKGRLLDKNQVPLAGVRIATKDGSYSTTTDENGYYQVLVPDRYHGALVYHPAELADGTNLPANPEARLLPVRKR